MGSDTADDVDTSLGAVGQRLDRDPGRVMFLLGKMWRHVAWARTEGIAKLIEEDGLDLRDRLRLARRKRAWRRRYGVPRGTAQPVMVVGLQRSGTNMVLRGIDRLPQTDVHNENDRRAFQRYRVKDAAIAPLVASSRAACVLFKPLCDSHRVLDLMAMAGSGTPAKAVWIYRSVDGRVRSSLAKFGDHDLSVVRAIAAGRGSQLWQAGGLSPAVLRTLESMVDADLTPAEGSALFWWARNSLVFDLGLERRDDVLLVSYDSVVADPVARLDELCGFLGIAFTPSVAEAVDARSSGASVALRPAVRELCAELHDRLERARLSRPLLAPQAVR